jgi:hypothetical protein
MSRIMNKKFASIATAALALSLSWVGCNKSEKLSQPSTFTPPTGQVELKLKWPEGEHIVQDINMQQDMEISIPGQPAPMKQNMTMGQEYGLTVLKATAGGGPELELEFLNVRMGMGMGGKSLMAYDSSKKSPADKTDPAAEMFGKIIGSKIRYFLNASNGVERLEGVKELVDRLTSGAKANDLALLKSMFTEGYFKQMMSQNQFMPPKAVQPGDTWPVKLEYPMGAMGTMEMDYKFTLQGWEMHGKRNCARMDFQGTIKSKPDANPNPAGMTISSLEGTSTGTSWFDPDFGIIIDTTMNQDINMVMKVPAKGAAQNISSHMTQVMNIKLASVK